MRLQGGRPLLWWRGALGAFATGTLRSVDGLWGRERWGQRQRVKCLYGCMSGGATLDVAYESGCPSGGANFLGDPSEDVGGPGYRDNGGK